MTHIFISYSHDSAEHKERVAALAKRLQKSGVAVRMDRDAGSGGPPEGWPQWSETQVTEAHRVLVICTAAYFRRYEAKEAPGKGLGAVCEARTIRQELYDSAGMNEKFRVVLFGNEDVEHIPQQLKAYHRFDLFATSGYEQLRSWLAESSPAGDDHGKESGSVIWPQLDSKYVSNLADRRDELGLLRKMLSGELDERILLLNGTRNCGKTALLSEIVSYAKQVSVPAARVDFKGCPSLEDVLQTVLLDFDQSILPKTHGASGTSRFYQLLADLQEQITPLLLVFDTYQQATDDATKWLENQLLARLDRLPAIVVVIAGQVAPDPSKHSWGQMCEVREVTPITRIDDWIEYVEKTWGDSGPTPENIKLLTRATGGEPGRMLPLLENLAKEPNPGTEP